MIECAKHKLHAMTSLANLDQFNLRRIGLVLYQHKKLTYSYHSYFDLQQR